MDTYELQLSDFLTNKLESLLESEREQFPTPKASINKNAVHEMKRYSAFLSIVKRRALDASDRGNKTLRCCAGRPPGPVKDELLASFEALAIHFQMEMESFYMFAKLYLDKTVHFLETYFGQQRGCKFESFSRFDPVLVILTTKHGFIDQPDLFETAKLLQEAVVGFRDKRIVHLKHSRIYRGLNWKVDGRCSMAFGYRQPKDGDGYVATLDVRELWKLLEDYTELFTKFVAENALRAKGRKRPTN